MYERLVATKSPAKNPTRAEHAASMSAYIAAGEKLAAKTGNRGSVRLDGNGNLHPEILAAFRDKGFYVFEGVIDAQELDVLRAEANNMIELVGVPKG